MDKITHKMCHEYWERIITECNQCGMQKKDWMKPNKVVAFLFGGHERRWHGVFSIEEKTVVTHRIALCCVLGSYWLAKCVFIPR